MKRFFLPLIFLALPASAFASNADYSKLAMLSTDRAYDQALLAPDGKHFAITAPIQGKSGLVVFSIQNLQAVAAFNLEANQDILRFWWANNERIVVNLALKGASADYPLLTGELFAFNIDNTRKFAIAGFTAGDSADYQFLDPLRSDKKLIRVVRSDVKNRQLDLARPAAYTLDIYKRARIVTGTNMKQKRLQNKYNSPYSAGGFVADNEGELRLAYQIDRDNNLKISRRDYSIDQWIEISGFSAPMAASSNAKTKPIIGFDSEDQGVFYLGKSKYGTTGLFHLNVQSAEVTALYEHEQIDIDEEDLIYASDHEVVGVNLQGTDGVQFFATHPEVARLQNLVKTFKGNRVEIINYSSEGELALVNVQSEGVESGLYLFDSRNNSLSLLMSARSS